MLTHFRRVGLNLRIDSVRRELVSAGPVIAAMAAQRSSRRCTLTRSVAAISISVHDDF
jgi:hypothetical protein